MHPPADRWQTRRTILAVGLLLAASGGVAQQPIEEIVVKAYGHCGSWPVAHKGTRHCLFAELKGEMLATVLEQRPKFIDACMKCDHEKKQCEPRHFSTRQMEEARICKRLYWTPTRVPRAASGNATFNAPLEASYLYDISAQGEITNIRLTFVEGRSENSTLRLLRQGAQHNQYAPLMINEAAYSIINLEGDYSLYN